MVVDTTEFFTDLRQRRGPWKRVLLLARRGRIRLWVPDVVVREAARHHQVETAKHRRELKVLLGKMADFNDAPLEGLADVDAVVGRHEQLSDGYRDRLVERLAEAGGVVLSLPSIPHGDLIDRALADRKPFRVKDAQGDRRRGPDGYRDALIWASVVEAVHAKGPVPVLYFVTKNTGDFCDRDKLAGSLLEELPDGVAAEHYATLEKLLDAVPLEADPHGGPNFHKMWLTRVADGERFLTSLRDAVAVACELLAGTELVVPDDEYAHVAEVADAGLLPAGLQNPTIEEVIPDLTTITWVVHNTDDKVGLAELRVDAEVFVEGFMAKADYAGEADGITLLDPDWNSHMVRAGAHVTAMLRFGLTIVSDSEVDLVLEGLGVVDPTRTG